MRLIFTAVALIALMCGCDAPAPSPAPDETTMPLTLHLHASHLGDQAREATNPFTGEKLRVPSDEGLSAAEREAVLELLSRNAATDPDPDGYYYVQLADDCRIGIGAPTLSSQRPCVGIGFECDRLTDTAIQFLFELSRAGNLSIGSSSDPDHVAFTAQPNDRQAKRWPAAAVLEDPAQLAAWLQASGD